MGGVNPVRSDPKQIVREGYDECGPRYAASRDRGSVEVLRALIERLPKDASVLDIGCGAGDPVSTTLSRYASVTGVDISRTQIEAARVILPSTTTLIEGDITSIEFDADSFDAVVALYTLFHIPREEHEPLLAKIAGWLKPGGRVLITTARTAHPGYTEDDFCGVTMYWSHFGPEWYAVALEDLGFKLLQRGVLPPGSGDGHDHPTILAMLPAASGGAF